MEKQTATEVTEGGYPITRLQMELTKTSSGKVGFIFELLPFGGKIIAIEEDVAIVFARLCEEMVESNTP
jgi:hypothetical protein